MAAPECCNKINKKSVWKASIAVFIALFATDFLIHGVLLKGMYTETASLWRPEEDMRSLFHWMLLGQLIVALAFTRLFAHGHQNKGVMEGVCFGMMMAVFIIGHNVIMYSVAPWPMKLVGAWSVLGFIQSLVLGAVAAKVYRPSS